ncbi:MAG: pyrroline-5-carboxylate reductase [Clostridia bacterium]|nr:pyrroline-5-carboxylate reductase [Clostridia bacterium]
MKYTLGVIGFGVMGQAIVKRAVTAGVLSASDVIVYDIDAKKITDNGLGFIVANDVSVVLEQAERVLFAVKPQHYADIIRDRDLSEIKTILSIMAGVKTATLREKCNFSGGIVRIMPNTPCGLGKGVCAYYADRALYEEIAFVTRILNSCGEIVPIPEESFDAVTSVSGSGPAYVYTFAQGMIEGGMNGGLTYEQAKVLALNTLIGAAELAKRSDEPLEELVQKVCSKGGTTIEAVKIYQDKGLATIIAEGIDACRIRSKELSESL